MICQETVSESILNDQSFNDIDIIHLVINISALYCWRCTVSNTSKMSHAHFQCVHNNYARFEEWQSKGVKGVDYTH